MIASLHGIKITALEQSWSVTVSIESYPCDLGSLVMKSIATTSNGVASGFRDMGYSAAFHAFGLLLCLWHSAHPATNSCESDLIVGHQ